MIDFLRLIIDVMSRIHYTITQLNDTYQINMTDKQLHFWVFGFVCIIMFVAVHFIFKWIAKHSIVALSFIYTFTVAVVLAFAIEIGQYQSKTGHMEFADILYGLYGFVLMFVIGLIAVITIKYIVVKLRS
jgi:glycopeptide antibiotics resistance protein